MISKQIDLLLFDLN